MGWKYEIVVLGEDGKNVIVHRNVSVAGKMVDILYVKRGYERAYIQLRMGSSYGLEAERWREKAQKAGLSDLNRGWQSVSPSVGTPPVSGAQTKQMNWVFAVQDDRGKWKNQGFNAVNNQKKTIKVGEGVFETVYSTTINIRSSSRFSLGRFYWLEPYFKAPDFQKRNNIYGMYVVFFDDPQLMDISWAQCKKNQTLLPLLQSYGNTVNLEVVSHRMPNDVLSSFHSFGRYHLTVFCGDKVLKKQMVSAKNAVSDVKLTSRIQIPLLIEPSWREVIRHKANNGEKEFRIEIESDLMYNPKAQRIKPGSMDSGVGSQISDTKKIKMQPYSGIGTYSTTGKRKLRKQLRFKVRYEKKTEIQERRSENVSKMLVVVGKNDREFKAPVNNPCKYTAIEISSPGREPYLIFEETEEGVRDLTGLSGFDLVAGEHTKSSNVGIVLKNLDTKSCRNKTLSHRGDKNIFDLSKMKLLGMREDDYRLSGNKLEMTLRYDYNKTCDTNLGRIRDRIVDLAWLFRYFRPEEAMKQSYLVLVNTCAYPNQMVNINVYPDIEWTFHLNYGMKNPLFYRDTMVQMRQHRVEQAFNKGQAADIDGYDGTLQTSFSLALECKWNKTESAKLDLKILKKIQLFVGSFLKMKKFVDQVTGKDKGNSTEGFSADLLERVRRTPLSIEVQSPKLSIAAGWKYECGRKEEQKAHKLALTTEIKAKADPLVGAEATIDLIAWGKKLHPMANAVISALDLLAYAANAEVRFDLIFYGKLLIEGGATFSTLNRKDRMLEAKGRFGFKLILSATATGKLEKYFFSVDFDFGAKAQAEGYFSAGVKLGVDDHKGIYFKPVLSHSGIKISYSYYVKVNGYRRTASDKATIIKSGKADIDRKYYING